MSKRKRFISPFGLSFLDVMSCGFGATILIFMLIKHNTADLAMADSSGGTQYQQVQSKETRLLLESIQALSKTVNQINNQLARAQKAIVEQLKAMASLESKEQDTGEKELNALKKALENKHAALLKEKEKGKQLTSIENDGRRQYLTGMSMQGKRILILFDQSASMLDDELINIVRNKYLPASEKRKAGKWRWGTAILRWMIAHLPNDAKYQIYSFNHKTTPLLPTERGWISANNQQIMKKMLKNINQLVPTNGTNLQSAFQIANRLKPQPDAIYLITDGLPTLKPGSSQSALVTGNQRRKLFVQAVQSLPDSVPVHTVLLPTKGDPTAAGQFWSLSSITNGRFLAPPWDWP